MPGLTPSPGSLVLYKIRPALVSTVSDKIDIVLEGGKTKRVRAKDIEVLHPGPLDSLDSLVPLDGDVDEALELLEGEQTHLQELTELLYGDFTPVHAWSAWQLVAEGLYFEGIPRSIQPRSREQIEADLAAREEKAAAEAAWEAFLARLRGARLEDEDRERLIEVERLALQQASSSRIMQALGHAENAENAHRMLISTGYWDARHNPYPARQAVEIQNPQTPVPGLPEVPRLDLTHLPAFAIDDQGSNDPDDAVSFDGERLWVHVADVAALATPDSDLDLEARGRGANLYLPEGIVHMLPPAVTQKLGLGLQEISPALSFGFRIDEQGNLSDIEPALTWIRASRHTYEEINGRLHEEPFSQLLKLSLVYRSRRAAAGSARLDLPEVSVRCSGDEVRIRPLERLDSREMVTDLMLMAGEAAAKYSLEHQIAVPFATQPPPDSLQEPEGMAAMYAYRRQFKPSQSKTLEAPHSGLGLEVYTRATSPLRRYLDLVTHQQIRAHLLGLEPMAVKTVSERIGASDAVTGAIRRAERLSNTHWKMIYLQQHPKWQGEGVVVEQDERRATVIIPELALETRLRLREKPELDERLQLVLREVDLPELSARFALAG
jgi:exoribonuclease-2